MDRIRDMIHRTRRRVAGRLVGERGSLSVYFVSAVIAVIPVIGLVVDGSGQIRALQQANHLATEAARYAGQSLEKSCAIKGADVEIYPPDARAAAAEYIAMSDADASLEEVRVFNGRHAVTVTTTVTYDPIFLGMVGVGSQQLQGEGTAYQHRTDLQGEEYTPSEPDSVCEWR